MQFYRMIAALVILYVMFGVGQSFFIGSRTFLQAWRVDGWNALAEAFRWPLYFARYETQGIGIAATIIIFMTLLAYWGTQRKF